MKMDTKKLGTYRKKPTATCGFFSMKKQGCSIAATGIESIEKTT